MFFRICQHCGAHLDPDEKCDCREKERLELEEYEKQIKTEQDGQIAFALETA
ncbi:MAG: hypothetical protein NC225_12715 [Clostridium sp.]|nr:hypothetical protein [Clostridium sp.]MCM1459700.1 hypothetical protein [Bacteroides sp.]